MSRLAPRPLLLIAASSAAVCLLALAPALRAAVATTPAVVVREVPVRAVARAGGQLRTVALPIRADMLGVTWTGSTHGLELRAAGSDGRWSRWVEIEASDDGPDASSREARKLRGRSAMSVPLWVGDANRMQLRTAKGTKINDVRVTALNVSGTATSASRIRSGAKRTAARVLGVAAATDASAMPASPAVNKRSVWGAISARSAPIYADRALGVVVHHTATANGYSCAQVPALLRGIQRYHEGSLGWNDIGYNFVVDRCGTVWEGRGGGIGQAVIGAHTSGFNTGTVGIAILGTHSSAAVSAAARRSVARLIAWRMDVAHVVPTGSMTLEARSSDKFPVGTRVTIPAVSGHRDLFPTTCPGRIAYGTLRSMARTATATGGLKVANVSVAPSIDATTGGLTYVRVRATSNSAIATMRLSLVRATDGAVLATNAVVGRVGVLRMSTSLNGAPAAWDVRVKVEARLPSGQIARPYNEPLARYSTDPGFAVTTAPPTSVAPGGDPVDDNLTFSYTMATRARLGVWLYDPATLTWIRTLQSSVSVAATSAPVPTTITIPADLPDGEYEVRIGVEDDTAPGRSMRRYPLRVTRTV